MKLLYCIRATYNPGGMERVLLNKVTYLVEKLHWEVLIVTTDQQGRPPFYPFPDAVRMVDLGINYSDDNDKRPLGKIAGYLRRRRRHRKALTALLQREKADVVVSLYPSESSFIPDIKDGSKKVLELHYCKFFRLQYGRKGLLGLIDQFRPRQDERIVRRFDRFVVLTREDRGYWG
ncbi:glycosyltransferase family 4 protein, partial [Phocaeicola vulgatus]